MVTEIETDKSQGCMSDLTSNDAETVNHEKQTTTVESWLLEPQGRN